MEEAQSLIRKPRAKVRELEKGGVDFPGHRSLEAAIEGHTAVVGENKTPSCILGQNGTAWKPQTHWRHRCMGAPRLDWLTKRPIEPMPGPPRTPLALPGGNGGAHDSEINGVPPGYVYIHTPLPSAQFSNLDAYSKDCKRDEDFIPDLLPDEGISTGLYLSAAS